MIHVGQLAGVRALRAYPIRWLVLLLWVPRAVAAERLHNRGSTDIERRLEVWDQTRDDLVGDDSACLDFAVCTDKWPVADIVAAIAGASSAPVLRPVAEVMA